jgi:hypothetical protein
MDLQIYGCAGIHAGWFSAVKATPLPLSGMFLKECQANARRQASISRRANFGGQAVENRTLDIRRTVARPSKWLSD